MAGADPAPAVALRDLRRAYGERVALDGVTLSLPHGATLAVFGANGAGKTTLLRVLATLLRPHAGEARVLGCALPREGWAVRGRVGLLAHEPLLYRDLTALENLRFHARLHGVAAGRAGELLEAVGMARRADEPVRSLSRGMAQRVAICRALLHEPELLLLDEPLANLDPGAAGAVAPLIGRASGATRVLISHDVEQGLAEADLVLGLRAGRPALLAPAQRGRRRRRARAVPVRRAVGAIVRKDLRIELRTGEAVPAMLLFSVSTFVLFHFALDRRSVEGELAAGVLWMTLLFAAVLGIVRLFVAEREQGGFDGFMLAPVDRSSLFVAKAVVLFCFLVAVELAVVPAFAILLLGPSPWEAVPELIAVLLLADAGIAVVGTLIGALGIQTRARELIVPILALPLMIPLAIAAARATSPLLLEAGAQALPGRWLLVLGLYDLVFGLLAFAVFDFLLEE